MDKCLLHTWGRGSNLQPGYMPATENRIQDEMLSLRSQRSPTARREAFPQASTPRCHLPLSPLPLPVPSLHTAPSCALPAHCPEKFLSHGKLHFYLGNSILETNKQKKWVTFIQPSFKSSFYQPKVTLLGEEIRHTLCITHFSPVFVLILHLNSNFLICFYF